MNHFWKSIVALVITASFLPPSLAVTTYYVDLANPSCSDSGPGSQATPFCKIQPGINAAVSGDTVIVRPGVYAGTGNRDLTSTNKNITVRAETNPRDTIIECGGDDLNPHRGFRLQNSDSTIQGFTIRHGYVANHSTEREGGGILAMQSSSPTIVDCAIVDCVAYNGGGIAVIGESPIMRDCRIACNHALADWTPPTLLVGGNGSGVYISATSGQPVIERCVVEGNTVGTPNGCTSPSASAGAGGGVYTSHTDGTQKVIVADSIIHRNGACFGAGLADMEGQITVKRCSIAFNTAYYGGGGIAIVPNQTNLTVLKDIANCEIRDNSGGKWGGGIYVLAGVVRAVNLKIADNRAEEGAGVLVRETDAQVTLSHVHVVHNIGTMYPGVRISNLPGLIPVVNIHNSMVVDNQTFTITPQFEEISGTVVNVRYTEQPYPQGPTPPPWVGAWDNNIVADLTGTMGTPHPRFTRELKLVVPVSSFDPQPAIDSAKSVAVNNLIPNDFADLNNNIITTEETPLDIDSSRPRRGDISTASDCLQAPGTCGTGPIADMGPYEQQVWNNVNVKLNRYLLIPSSLPVGEMHAIRVTFAANSKRRNQDPNDLWGSYSDPMWVGPIVTTIPPGSVRRLSFVPYWEAFGTGEVVVGDANILPSEGGVHVEYRVGSAKDGALFTSMGTFQTARWGDTNNSQSVSNGDIIAVLNGFQGIFTGPQIIPPRRETVDLAGPGSSLMPNMPDYAITNQDVIQVLNAFQGMAYTFVGEPNVFGVLCNAEGMSGGESASAPSGDESLSDGSATINGQLINAIVGYFSALDAADDAEAKLIPEVVDGLWYVCDSTMSAAEKSGLAALLADPTRDFASSAGADAAATLAGALQD